MDTEEQRDELAEILLAILQDARPKTAASHKFVAASLLDLASEALARMGK